MQVGFADWLFDEKKPLCLINPVIKSFGKDYLRINSAAENINWNLDDYSEKNLEDINCINMTRECCLGRYIPGMTL